MPISLIRLSNRPKAQCENKLFSVNRYTATCASADRSSYCLAGKRRMRTADDTPIRFFRFPSFVTSPVHARDSSSGLSRTSVLPASLFRSNVRRNGQSNVVVGNPLHRNTDKIHIAKCTGIPTGDIGFDKTARRQKNSRFSA